MKTDDVQDQQSKSNFNEKYWIIGTTLSMAIAGVLAFLFVPTGFIPFSDAARWCMATTLGGILVGAVQGYVLKGEISSAWAWCLFTAGGWLAGAFLVTGVEKHYVILSPTTIYVGPVGSVLVGIVQWLIFWRRSRLGWTWPLFSVMGAVFGTALVSLLGVFLLFFAWSHPLLTNTLGSTVGGAVELIVIGFVIGLVAGSIYAGITASTLRSLIVQRPV